MILPPDSSTLEEILAQGGSSYLDTLPNETLASTEMDSSMIYRKMIGAIAPQLIELGTSLLETMIVMDKKVMEVPGAPVYQEAVVPFDHGALVLEIQPPDEKNDPAWPHYRISVGEADFNVLFAWDPKGLFDIERLARPSDVVRVPLETYFPPVAILRYDEQGNRVEPPRELRPTLNPTGYIQSPPLMLTTLEAARALRGEAAISAIRVRVALDGCPAGQAPETCPMTLAAQRKIEAIAIEIAKQTGLDVDIMVGSSPKRILVRVPGIGYVEEQWIQKGVNLTYRQGIQTGNWLLLATLLATGGLFTLDLTWAEVMARRRFIALQKALGWRSRTVFAHVLGQTLLIGAVAVVVGTLGAFGIMQFLNWQAPPAWLWLGLPPAVLGMAALGALAPAWQAGRVPPIIELQRGGLRHWRSGQARLDFGLWALAWRGLLRRPGRALLTGLTAVLSAALLVLLLGVTLQQQGMLSGTLLGEFILVRIERFHYALVGIGLGLAAFSTANSLLAGVRERQREIGVLKATGWRTWGVAWLFVLEGLWLGVVGGAAGALLGGLAFAALYRSVSPGLGLALLAGVSVPGLVGMLAALYPARVAARVPPAEALRYE
ncbi:MAG: FtsX-like permease family protein [Anaerolineales bacterium]|nr:FtsX-like permease family protein [Anaerolineales bacterium]